MPIISKGVGIDLGTTNSAVAVMNPTDTDIVIHKDAAARSETTPSCVWKDPKSGEIVVGRRAFRRIGSTPVPVRSIKRVMGKSTTVRLTNEEASPEQVSALILKEMKRQIEEDVARLSSGDTNWVVDRAIVTVPAYFDQPQIDATRKAAQLAGLEVLDLLHEPTAAACHHCWRTGTQNGLFLVYDFGGGTFDVTVLRSTAGLFQVLGISGNNFLGGDDLDTALAEHLRERLLRDDYRLDLDVKNDPEDQLRFEILKFMAEGIKKALSNEVEFLFRDQGQLKDKEGNPVVIETEFSRAEIEGLLRPIIERTIPYCQEAIERAQQKAGVTLADVDQIILAGGSTHIPLVRELVRAEFCASPQASGPRAKCAEPLYDKVDTIVALGAAIRASAVGGLAVYNQERSVRVSFRGTAATGATDTHVGGKVEALAPGISLQGGRVRLVAGEFDADTDLADNGTFGFRQVPLQPGAENLLTFEVCDASGNLLTSVGRPITHSREAGQRPTGGGGSTAVISKPFLLEVMRAGKPTLRELIPALQPLPTDAEFEFSHPGNTERIRLPLFQHKRKIQEILVPVPSSLPKGAPVKLNVHVDHLSFITVRGTVGETPFDAAVELPADRGLPTPEAQAALEKAFREAVSYLPAGKKAVVEAKWRRSKQAFDDAAGRGDEAQAVHELEELEELVASIAKSDGALEPPKNEFDELVKTCHEINDYVTKAAAEAGQPHDQREMAKAIETQREQGEKAFAAADQGAYGDTIAMLEQFRAHLAGLYRKVAKIEDTRSPAEKATGTVKHVKEESDKIARMAASQKRPDLQHEVEQLQVKLSELEGEAHQNPRGAEDKARAVQARLEQMKNILMSRAAPGGAKDLIEDHS